MFFKNGCRILCFLWENTAWAIARVDLRPLMLYFSAVKSMVYSMDDYTQPDGRGNNRRGGKEEQCYLRPDYEGGAGRTAPRYMDTLN